MPLTNSTLYKCTLKLKMFIIFQKLDESVKVCAFIPKSIDNGILIG